jgi:hypothetical protein
MPEQKRFWLVWSPQGGPPMFRYPSFNSARSGAIRLSLKFPDQDFFIMESVWFKLGTPPDEAEPLASDAPVPDGEVGS